VHRSPRPVNGLVDRLSLDGTWVLAAVAELAAATFEAPAR
jgi:hypothetical protein